MVSIIKWISNSIKITVQHHSYHLKLIPSDTIVTCSQNRSDQRQGPCLLFIKEHLWGETRSASHWLIICSSCDLIPSGWWYTYPSEKYESQLGWLFPIIWEKMFQTTNQPQYLICDVRMGWSLNITGTPPSFCGWISPLSDTPKWGFGPQNQGVLHQWIGSRENFSIGNHWTPSISFPSFFVGFSPGISHPILISLKLSMMESIGWLRFIQLSNR